VTPDPSQESGPDARRIEAVRRVIDALAPNTWDACVWIDNNYVTGRIDIADKQRIAAAVLSHADIADGRKLSDLTDAEADAFLGAVLNDGPDDHQCEATTTMMDRTYRCERYRGHPEGMHYSLMGRLDMVQWPDARLDYKGDG
jgi:hypothetical protein